MYGKAYRQENTLYYESWRTRQLARVDLVRRRFVVRQHLKELTITRRL